MDLTALEQKVNRVFSLIAAWINFIPAFFSSTPQDVTVTWENENGSTTTQAHPNLKKMLYHIKSHKIEVNADQLAGVDIFGNHIGFVAKRGQSDQKRFIINMFDNGSRIRLSPATADGENSLPGASYFDYNYDTNKFEINGDTLSPTRLFYTDWDIDESDAKLTGSAWGDTSIGIDGLRMRGWHTDNVLTLNVRFRLTSFGTKSFPNDDSLILYYNIKDRVKTIIPNFAGFSSIQYSVGSILFSDKVQTNLQVYTDNDKITIRQDDFGGVFDGASQNSFSASEAWITANVSAAYYTE